MAVIVPFERFGDVIRLAWRQQPPIPEMPDYLVWSSLSPDEGQALRDLSLGKRVIEIGAAFGFSASAMAWRAEHVWSLDPHAVVPAYGLFGIEQTTNPEIYQGGTLEHMRANLSQAGLLDKVTICVGYSQNLLAAGAELATELTGKELDFAFIDGDHSYGMCLADLRNCERILTRPATIAIHDFNEMNNQEVSKAINDWRGDRPMRLVDTLAIVEL